MADNNSSTASSGIGLAGGVFIVFLSLKLCHVIDWSWWWVTAPLWAGVALLLAIFALPLLVVGLGLFLAGVYALVAALVAKLFRR